MTGDRLGTLAFLLLALTLPMSSLIARRMPLGQTARLIVIWFAIIVGGAALVAIVRGGSPILAKLHMLVSANELRDPYNSTMHVLHNKYYQDD